MAFDAGTITAELRLDRGEFTAELAAARRQVEQFTRRAHTARVRLVVDGGAALAAMRAQIAALSRTRVVVRVRTDMAAARTEIAALRADLTAIAAMRPTVVVRTALQGVAALRAQLATIGGQVAVRLNVDDASIEALRVRLAALDLSVRVRVEMDEASEAALRARIAALAAMNPTISFNVGGTGTLRMLSLIAKALKLIVLPLALLSLAPLLASIGAAAVAAVGALWAIPAVLGAIGAAIATVIIGFKGLGTAISATDPEELTAALEKLAPAAREVALAVRGFRDEWSTLQQAVQQNLFAGLAGHISDLASNYLPVLQARLAGIAAGWNDVFHSALDALNQQQSIADTNAGLLNTEIGLRNAAGAAGPLVQAMRDIMVVGSTFLPQWGTGLTEAATRFRDFIAAARESGQLRVWIEQGIEALRQLGALIGNVVGIIADVFRLANEAGGNLIVTANEILRAFRGALATPEGAASIIAFFRTIRETVAAAMPGLSAVADVIGYMIRTLGPVLPGIGAAFSAIATAVAPLAKDLILLASVALPPVVGFLTTLAQSGDLMIIAAGVMAMVVAVRLFNIALKAWAVAQAVVNALLVANPIGLIVVALIGLGAALIYAWRHSEDFRNGVIGAFEAVQGFVMGVVDWFRGPFVGFFVDSFNAVRDAAASIGQFFVDLWRGVQDTTAAVVDFFVELPGRIGAALVSLGDSIATGATNAWGWLTSTAQTAWDGLIAWLLGLPESIAYGLGWLAGTLTRLAIEGWNGFTTGITTAWTATMTWFTELPGRIGAALTSLGGFLATTAQTAWAAFTGGITSAWTATWEWLVGLPARIGEALAGLGDWLSRTATDAWNAFTGGITAAWTATWEWLVGTPERAGEAIGEVGETLGEKGRTGWEAFTTGIVSAWEATAAWFVALPGRIGAFFTDAGTWLTQTGTDILNGLLGGLQSMWNSVVDWFTGLANSFMQGFRDALGIASPSTVFYQFAVDILQGLINGLASLIGAVIGFFADLGAQIAETFRLGMQVVQDTAVAIWTFVANYFARAFGDFIAFYSGVWTRVRDFFVATWNAIRDTAVAIWNVIAGFFTSAFEGYRILFTTVWSAIRDFFAATWDTIRTIAVTLWNGIRDFFAGAFSAFVRFFTDTWNGIVTTFDQVWSGVTDIARRVWDSVRRAFIDGVNGVIGIINGFAGVINTVAGLLGFNIKLGIEPLRYATGGPVEIPARYAVGGAIPGYSPGRDTVPALLSPGEYVIRPEAAKAIGRDRLDRLNAAHRDREAMFAEGGPVARFAEGGAVWQQMWGAVRGRFPTARLTSSTRPGSRTRSGGLSYHAQGKAIDVAGPRSMDTAAMGAINRWIAGAYPQSTELIYTPGTNLYRGRPHVYSAGVRSDHYDHVHWAMESMGKGVLGRVGDFFGGIWESLKSQASKLLDGPRSMLQARVDNGPLGEKFVAGSMIKVIDHLFGVAEKKDSEMMASADPGGSGVERWRGVVHQALQLVGQPLSHDNITLRRMNQESSGNPLAVNNWDVNARRGTPSKGLMQVIDPTFRAHRHPATRNNIFDPLSNVAASMRYALSRYGSLPRAYNRPGGYDSGGWLPPGMSQVWNGTAQPEAVLTNEQWATMRAAATDSDGPDTAALVAEMRAAAREMADQRPLIGSVVAPSGADAREFFDELNHTVRRARHDSRYARG